MLMTPKDRLPSDTFRRRAPTKRAFEGVADEIRRRIMDGELKLGDKLPAERDLATEFQVSRNTVREAVRSLENAALLKLRRGPGGGAFVSSGDSKVLRTGMADLLSLGLLSPENLQEAREIIGVAVARLAAQRRTFADIEAIRANMRALESPMQDADLETRAHLGFEFQRLLAKATQNPALAVLTDAVIGLNLPMVRAAGMRDPAIANQFRRKIFQHIERQDSDSAAAEMAAYLEKLRRYYQSKLGNPSP